jgi:hypothetical protein
MFPRASSRQNRGAPTIALHVEDRGVLMSFGITMADADGNTLEGPPGEAPTDSIGAVVETPSGGYVAVPATAESEPSEGNLGLYATFELAVEALRDNHRRELRREERRRAAGGC